MATRLLHALFISAGIAAGTALAQDASYDLDLPSGSLAASVETLARQTGLQVLFDQRLLDGKQSGALKGRMSAREALDKLLAGSGLSVVATGDGTFALRPAPKGNDGAAEHRLGEIVVAATRTANPIDEVPASVSVATREDFDDVQASDVAQVMKKMPNVEFGGGPRIGGEIPTIRGYYGASVAVSVDGARQNDVTSPGMRSPLHVDPYFLRQVEVLHGPASSLYGSGGNGGAMLFTTLSARDLLQPGQAFGVGAHAGYASADKSWHGNARAYGGNEMLDGLVAISHRDWDKIRQGGGTYLEPNDGHSDSALVKGGLNAGGARYELSHQSYRSENLQPRNPQADAYAAGAPVVSLNHVDQQQTVLQGATTGNGPWSVAGTLYDTRLEFIDDQGANAIAAPRATMATKTTGGSLQGSLSFSGAGDHRLTTGVDAYESTQSATSAGVPNPVNPDGSQQVTGLFVQDEILLGGQWRLIPSVRNDRFETTATNVGRSTSASHTSPKITLAWQPLAGLMVYGNYGEAFRAPTLGETYGAISGTNYFMNFRANTDLKPELDKTYEIGGNYVARGLVAAGDLLRLRLAYFDGKAEDLISSTNVGRYTRTAPFVGTGFIWQYQNVSSADRKGAELETGYEIGAWQTKLAYSRVRVTNASTGAGLFSPPDKLNLRVRWETPLAGLALTWNSTGVAKQDYDATTLRRRPGYATHDLFATWVSSDKRYRADFGVTNLSDKRYATYQSAMAYGYVYDVGRSVRASLTVDF
jgi:hemoglobin/transferrin/lactoferrin receptor protein